MQPRKDDGRSRKTTKATTRAPAARPKAAKTDKAKARSEKTKANVKAVSKAVPKTVTKPSKAKPTEAKPSKAKPSKAKPSKAPMKAAPKKAAAKPAPAKAKQTPGKIKGKSIPSKVAKAAPKSPAKSTPAKTAKVVVPKTQAKPVSPAAKSSAKKPEPPKLKPEPMKLAPKKAEPAKKAERVTKAEPNKSAAIKGKPPESKPLKATKTVVVDEETRPVEPSRTEPTRSNSAFARPSPWSAPALPPVRADATKPVAAPSEGDFAVGETVVYPGRGVSDIVAIETKDIGGKLQPFYTLRVHDTQQKVFVPVSTAAQAGMRRPISETEIREIFRILKVTDVPMDTQTWNRRFRGFLEKLQTGNVFTIAEVVRDLSRVRLAKDVLSFSERQMLEKARGLIVKEIAIARSKPEEQIREQIDAIFT